MSAERLYDKEFDCLLEEHLRRNQIFSMECIQAINLPKKMHERTALCNLPNSFYMSSNLYIVHPSCGIQQCVHAPFVKSQSFFELNGKTDAIRMEMNVNLSLLTYKMDKVFEITFLWLGSLWFRHSWRQIKRKYFFVWKHLLRIPHSLFQLRIKVVFVLVDMKWLHDLYRDHRDVSPIRIIQWDIFLGHNNFMSRFINLSYLSFSISWSVRSI